MGVIYCAQCEGKCSPDLDNCPHCGHPISGKLDILPPAMPVLVSPLRQAAQTRQINVLGIVSLALGAVTCAICWLPTINLVSPPLSILGILFGLAGIIMALVTKRHKFREATVGVLMSFAAVIVVSVFFAKIAASRNRGIEDIVAQINQEAAFEYQENPGLHALQVKQWEIVEIKAEFTHTSLDSYHRIIHHESWRVKVSNDSDKPITLHGVFHFQDSEGRLLQSEQIPNFTIPPKSTQTQRGVATLYHQIAAKMTRYRAELEIYPYY